jgi:hypothetical protein
VTAQIPDILRQAGHDRPLFTLPLESHLEAVGLVFRGPSTGHMRGYVGVWEIRDGMLYLVDFEACLDEDTMCRLPHLFPDAPPGGVPATWFSGVLRAPEGRLIHYVHMPFASVYERDLLIEVVQGRVLSRRVRLNGSAYDPGPPPPLERRPGEPLRAPEGFVIPDFLLKN